MASRSHQVRFLYIFFCVLTLIGSSSPEAPENKRAAITIWKEAAKLDEDVFYIYRNLARAYHEGMVHSHISPRFFFTMQASTSSKI
jgi:hypothetical protein